ncbi:MAG: recombinase A [Kofleriaceae bacterium]
MNDDLREFLARARGTAATAKVIRLDELTRTTRDEAPWGLPALRGRIVELSARGASGTLTCATSLVFEAQSEGEPVAWIVPWCVDPDTRGGSDVRTPGTFYPPDAADSGVDLSALVVVRAPSVIAAGRAAERLLRSGAFGLVVIDFGSSNLEATSARISDAMLGRLVSLAQANDAAIVCLTEKTRDAGSLGSLVSLRVEALRERAEGARSSDFEVTVRALKDKRRGPGWSRALKARGPSGL